MDNDDALVGRTLDGETAAFGVLVVRYERQVFSLMRRLAGSPDEAADLAQDAFVRAYESLGSFRRGARFFPWLYTIALNRARDWARRRRPGQMVELDGEEDALPGPAGDDPGVSAGRRDLSLSLAAALERLPLESREMLLLRYREEMSMREIAVVFGISEAAVKMRVGRGLARLRRLLGEEGHDPAD